MSLLHDARDAIARLPDYLRRRITLLLALLATFQGLVWAALVYGARDYPMLVGLATIAYGFGLRHAVDADHIAAIDNTTRKMMQDGKYPTAVGLFFSLGHSSIVMLLCLFVAVSANYVTEHLPAFKTAGSLIGMSVSCIFLLAIGMINLVALVALLKAWREWTIHKRPISDEALSYHLDHRGILARILRPVLQLVDHSWQLYFVGLLFGLGFDTATEIGLLSLSASSANAAIPVGYILLLPLAFTAAMTLIDTLNGILMLGAYGWAFVNPARKLFYNVNVTLISVATALMIGGIEALQLVSTGWGLDGGVFSLANRVELQDVGFLLVGVLLASWFLSLAVFKWKESALLNLDPGR